MRVRNISGLLKNVWNAKFITNLMSYNSNICSTVPKHVCQRHFPPNKYRARSTLYPKVLKLLPCFLLKFLNEDWKQLINWGHFTNSHCSTSLNLFLFFLFLSSQPLAWNFLCEKFPSKQTSVTWLANQDAVRTMTFFNDMLTESTIRGRRHKYHKKY